MPDSSVVVELAPLEPYVAGPACVRLPRGVTLAGALDVLGIRTPDGWSAGVWGRVAAPGRVLESGDRIEFTQPLQADPKTARRRRAQRRAAARVEREPRSGR